LLISETQPSTKTDINFQKINQFQIFSLIQLALNAINEQMVHTFSPAFTNSSVPTALHHLIFRFVRYADFQLEKHLIPMFLKAQKHVQFVTTILRQKSLFHVDIVSVSNVLMNGINQMRDIAWFAWL
jgi:hypothetical protein